MQQLPQSVPTDKSRMACQPDITEAELQELILLLVSSQIIYGLHLEHGVK